MKSSTSQMIYIFSSVLSHVLNNLICASLIDPIRQGLFLEGRWLISEIWIFIFIKKESHFLLKSIDRKPWMLWYYMSFMGKSIFHHFLFVFQQYSGLTLSSEHWTQSSNSGSWQKTKCGIRDQIQIYCAKQGPYLLYYLLDSINLHF